MKAVGNYVVEKEVLGKGQFGTVYRAHSKQNTKDLYACKQILRKGLTQRLLNNIKNETNILTKINSPNVIKLYDLQRTENNFYLIMEYCNGGDLENLKELRGRFSESEAQLILQQLIRGFQDIYQQQVMHRDLKLANLLIHFPEEQDLSFKSFPSQTSKINFVNAKLKNIDLTKTKFEIKIADLGFSRELQFDDLSETICGTPLIMAPEVLNGIRYNHKADVWSLGIIFFELITGFTPFTGRDREDLKRNLEKGEYKLPKKIKLSLPGLDFLNGCLQFDQIKRLSWENLVKHAYLTSNQISNNQLEQLKLSFSQMHGLYALDNIDESAIQMNDPYNYFNQKNAIMLNCKNSNQFQQVYEETIQKHFAKLEKGVQENQNQNQNQKSIFDDNNQLNKSQNYIEEEIKLDEVFNQQENIEFNINQAPQYEINLEEYKNKIQELSKNQLDDGLEIQNHQSNIQQQLFNQSEYKRDQESSLVKNEMEFEEIDTSQNKNEEDIVDVTKESYYQHMEKQVEGKEVFLDWSCDNQDQKNSQYIYINDDYIDNIYK